MLRSNTNLTVLASNLIKAITSNPLCPIVKFLELRIKSIYRSSTFIASINVCLHGINIHISFVHISCFDIFLSTLHCILCIFKHRLACLKTILSINVSVWFSQTFVNDFGNKLVGLGHCCIHDSFYKYRDIPC